MVERVKKIFNKLFLIITLIFSLIAVYNKSYCVNLLNDNVLDFYNENLVHWTVRNGLFFLQDFNGNICTDIRKYFPLSPDYTIIINKKANTVTVYALDMNLEYKIPVCSFLCSCGKNTPIGEFKLNGEKFKWHLMFDGSYGKYCTRIKGHILFHSIPYKKPDNNSIIQEDYNGLGVLESAGCIRLQAKDAYWIYKNIKKGTSIWIYEDEVPGPFGKPLLERKLLPNEFFDPTDPEITGLE